jgi:hypothetical protein
MTEKHHMTYHVLERLMFLDSVRFLSHKTMNSNCTNPQQPFLQVEAWHSVYSDLSNTQSKLFPLLSCFHLRRRNQVRRQSALQYHLGEFPVLSPHLQELPRFFHLDLYMLLNRLVLNSIFYTKCISYQMSRLSKYL